MVKSIPEIKDVVARDYTEQESKLTIAEQRLIEAKRGDTPPWRLAAIRVAVRKQRAEYDAALRDWMEWRHVGEEAPRG